MCVCEVKKKAALNYFYAGVLFNCTDPFVLSLFSQLIISNITDSHPFDCKRTLNLRVCDFHLHDFLAFLNKIDRDSQSVNVPVLAHPRM